MNHPQSRLARPLKRVWRNLIVVALIGIAIPIAFPTHALADQRPGAAAHGNREMQNAPHSRPQQNFGPAKIPHQHPRPDMFISDGNAFRCNRGAIDVIPGRDAKSPAGLARGTGTDPHAEMIGGAILGLLGGYGAGHNPDHGDITCTGYALQQIPDGQTAHWINPESHRQFDITPTRSWENTDGRYCREYTASAVIDGKQQKTFGTACIQPDGSWQIVS